MLSKYMDIDPDDLPTDPVAQRVLIHMLLNAMGDYRQLVLTLKTQISRLERIAFGRRSEKVRLGLIQFKLMLGDLEQPALMNNDDASGPACASNDNAVANDAGDASERALATPRPRKPWPNNLPRETVTHAICACPECGSGRLHKVGKERREIIERVPATLKVIEHVFPRMRCRDCDKTRRAPPPSLPIARAMVGPALLAHVCTAKFGDHLPLNRQSEIFARSGVMLSRQTLMKLCARGCSDLRPASCADRRACSGGRSVPYRRHADVGHRSRPIAYARGALLVRGA